MTEQKNRLHYALNLANENNTPIATQDPATSKWSQGVSIFIKSAEVNAPRNPGTAPGFVNNKLQQTVRDEGLSFAEIIVNRTDEQMNEAVRNDEKLPRKIASVMLLVPSEQLVRLAKNPDSMMLRKVGNIDKAFCEQDPDMNGLLESKMLISVDEAISNCDENELAIWQNIVGCRPQTNVLKHGYVVNAGNETGSFVTNDRFGYLASIGNRGQKTEQIPTNRAPSSDEANPF